MVTSLASFDCILSCFVLKKQLWPQLVLATTHFDLLWRRPADHLQPPKKRVGSQGLGLKGARRVGGQKVGRRRVGPEGWAPEFSALFPSPATNRSFCSFWRSCSWKCDHLWASLGYFSCKDAAHASAAAH